jgi:glycosyltransferase involved in cell wall biosynthesis
VGLTILSVAYPLAPVGPDAVGGAEQVLSMLDAALVRAGHRSIVIACEGSSVRGTLVSTPRADEPLDDERRVRAQDRVRRAIAGVLATERVDLVHCHGVDFPTYAPQAGPPVLATLHLPPHLYPGWIFESPPDNWFLSCVSADQRRRCPPSRRSIDVLPNGVPVLPARGRSRRLQLAVALGRICPEKGFHLALEAARALDLGLVLGGQVFGYPDHRRRRARRAPRPRPLRPPSSGALRARRPAAREPARRARGGLMRDPPGTGTSADHAETCELYAEIARRRSAAARDGRPGSPDDDTPAFRDTLRRTRRRPAARKRRS